MHSDSASPSHSSPPPPSPRAILKRARKELLEDLPEDADFLKRVYDNGELVPVQPKGVRRQVKPPGKSSKAKRGKPSDAPSVIIEKQRLIKMFNDQWDQQEEWEKAQSKMLSLGKKFGLRRSPFKPEQKLEIKRETRAPTPAFEEDEESEQKEEPPARRGRKKSPVLAASYDDEDSRRELSATEEQKMWDSKRPVPQDIPKVRPSNKRKGVPRYLPQITMGKSHNRRARPISDSEQRIDRYQLARRGGLRGTKRRSAGALSSRKRQKGGADRIRL